MNTTPDTQELRAEIATKDLDARGNLTPVETPILRHRHSNGDENTPTGSPPNNAAAKKHARRYLIIGVNVLPALVGLAFYYSRFVVPFESTDDAFIEAHVTPIAPQVTGRVSAVLVRDNQLVKAGDVLLQIEPSDYETKLEQARANLASAKSRFAEAEAKFSVDQAKVEQEKANVRAAEAEAKRAEADSMRYQAVGTSGVSESQLDLAATQSRSAAANLSAVRNKQLAAEAQIGLDQAGIQTAAAEIQRSAAAVRQAELDLSYTQVKAHEAGYVTRRSMEAGAYVQPGQSLLSVVARELLGGSEFQGVTAHAHARRPGGHS